MDASNNTGTVSCGCCHCCLLLWFADMILKDVYAAYRNTEKQEADKIPTDGRIKNYQIFKLHDFKTELVYFYTFHNTGFRYRDENGHLKRERYCIQSGCITQIVPPPKKYSLAPLLAYSPSMPHSPSITKDTLFSLHRLDFSRHCHHG